VLALVYILPFLIQVATAFKTDPDAASNPLSLIPDPFSLSAIDKLFTNSDFPLWFMNSAIITVFVTVGRVLFDSLAGYALARLHFRGRNVIFAGLVAVMAVPNVVLLIPKFLVLNQLSIYDSYIGLIVPLMADAAGVFIMKGFFESIPVAVEEAARIDGAGTLRLFWSVVLPMAQPALVTIIILSFQGSWNELAHFIVAAQNPALTPLTKGVATLASGSLGSGTQYPLKLAAAMIMTIPVAIMFFVFQKRIMSQSEGAVKE
jgi:multiple sugar transport system permease protein